MRNNYLNALRIHELKNKKPGITRVLKEVLIHLNIQN